MHARMHVCMHACMYVCMYVRMYVCTYVRVYVCMYVFFDNIYVYVQLYAYIHMYVYIYIFILRSLPWLTGEPCFGQVTRQLRSSKLERKIRACVMASLRNLRKLQKEVDGCLVLIT